MTIFKQEISLTDFVDVVSKSGSPKATKVNQIKNRDDYHPATDFYKKFRDGVIKTHKDSQPRTALFDLRNAVSDPKKIKSYGEILNGYNKWWGKKNIVWFDPPKKYYESFGIEVSINPELGLNIDGQRHIIKLYLKEEPLSRLRVDLVTVLMERSLRDFCEEGDVIGVLDVRKSKLFIVNAKVDKTMAMVDAELSYISSLWPHL